MKFFCDRCQTKYSIADEKVRRKVLKVRCKTCSNIIEVRESGASGPIPAMKASQPLKSPVVKPSQSPLGQAFDQAFTGYDDESEGQPTRIAAGAPGSAAAAAQGRAAPAAAVKQAPAYTQQIALDEDEWYFAVDGVQEGPLALLALVERVSNTKIADEPLVWRDGFDEWTLAHQVPEIKMLMRKPATVPPPSPAPPPTPSAALSGASKRPTPLAEMHAAANLAARPAQSASRGTGSQARSSLAAAAPLPPAPVPAEKEPQLAGFSVEAAARALNLVPGQQGSHSAVQSASSPSPFSPAPAQDFASSLFAASGSPPRGTSEARPNGRNDGRIEDLIPRPLAPSDDPNDDLLIGEASRIVRLPSLLEMPPPRAPRATAGVPRMTGARTALPGLANASGAAPAMNGGVGLGLGKETSGAVPEMSFVSSAVAPRKRRTRMIIIAAAVALVGLVVLLVAVFWPSNSDENTRLASGDDPYSGFNINSNGRLIERPGQPSIDINKAPVPVPGGTTPKPRNPGTGNPGKVVVAPPTGTQITQPGNTLPPLPKPGTGGDTEVDLFHKPGNADTGNPPADEAVKVAGDLRLGVKQCFERALKQDPSLKNLGKVDLTIKIGAAGRVKSASLGNVDETLSGCVEAIAKGRPFPKYSKDYSIEVPFYLRGS